MEHISDEIIYLFVINPNAIESAERTIIEKHIDNCSHCKEFLEESTNLFKTLNTLTSDRVSKEDFFNKMKTSLKYLNSSIETEENQNILHLYEQYKLNKGSQNFLRLAAMQNASLQNRDRYINTYASAQNFVLMRVMYTSTTKGYQLYLICEDMERVKCAIVSLEGINKDLVADENGIVSLKSGYVNAHLSFQLLLPVARFYLDFDDIKNSKKPVQIKSHLHHYNIDLSASMNFDKVELKFDYDDTFFTNNLKMYLINLDEIENFKTVILKDDKMVSFKMNENLSGKYAVILIEQNN
jgi:hypothetical protein